MVVVTSSKSMERIEPSGKGCSARRSSDEDKSVADGFGLTFASLGDAVKSLDMGPLTTVSSYTVTLWREMSKEGDEYSSEKRGFEMISSSFLSDFDIFETTNS